MRACTPTLLVLLLSFFWLSSTSNGQISHTPIPDSVLIMARQWDVAHDSHDTRSFSRIYSSEVGYYNRTIARRAILHKKAQYFMKHPDYHQSISDITVDTAGVGFTVRFQKRVDVKGNSNFYRSYLIIDSVGEALGGTSEQWRVVVEGDERTDSIQLRNLKTINVNSFRSCDDVENAILRSAPKIQKILEPSLIIDRDDDDSSGAHVYHFYLYPPLSGFTRTLGWYTFNPKTQVLMDNFDDGATTTEGHPARMEYDRSLLKYLKKFCK